MRSGLPPTTMAQPVVALSKLAQSMSTPLLVTRSQVGRSMTPRSARMLSPR